MRARARARTRAYVCVVSFIFKINYVDSKPKSAVKFHRENSRRYYAVEFLRVQSNWKIVIHVYRGCSVFPWSISRPRGKSRSTFHVFLWNCSFSLSPALNATAKVRRQIGCFIEQYHHDPRCDDTDVTIGAFTSTRSEIKCLFCLFCLFLTIGHIVTVVTAYPGSIGDDQDCAKIHRSSRYVRGFMILPLFRYFFFLNLGLKSKNASAVRRRLEVNRFNTLTLWFVFQSVLS